MFNPGYLALVHSIVYVLFWIRGMVQLRYQLFYFNFVIFIAMSLHLLLIVSLQNIINNNGWLLVECVSYRVQGVGIFIGKDATNCRVGYIHTHSTYSISIRRIYPWIMS